MRETLIFKIAPCDDQTISKAVSMTKDIHALSLTPDSFLLYCVTFPLQTVLTGSWC